MPPDHTPYCHDQFYESHLHQSLLVVLSAPAAGPASTAARALAVGPVSD